MEFVTKTLLLTSINRNDLINLQFPLWNRTSEYKASSDFLTSHQCSPASQVLHHRQPTHVPESQRSKCKQSNLNKCHTIFCLTCPWPSPVFHAAQYARRVLKDYIEMHRMTLLFYIHEFICICLLFQIIHENIVIVLYAFSNMSYNFLLTFGKGIQWKYIQV